MVDCCSQKILAIGGRVAFVLPARREVASHPESDLLGSALGGVAEVCGLVRRSISQSYVEILEKVAVRSNGHFFLYGSISFAIDSPSRTRSKAEY